MVVSYNVDMEMICITDARANAGLRRIDVAIRLGVDPITVYSWETGRYRPNADHLLRLAELYGVDPRAIRLPAKRALECTKRQVPADG